MAINAVNSVKRGEIAAILSRTPQLRLRDLPTSPENILRAARRHPRWAKDVASALEAMIEWRGGADRNVRDLLQEVQRLADLPALCH